MSGLEFKNLLLIGMDVNPLARSAKNAGYRVHSVDYFGDQDLRRSSDDHLSVIDQKEGVSCGRLDAGFDAETLLEGAKVISSRNLIDGILLSTGLDDSPRVLSELTKIAPIIGNSPESIQKVRDKERFFRELERLRVPVPQTAVASDLSEAWSASKEIGYPLLVKPMQGFGGGGIRKVENSDGLGRTLRSLYSQAQQIMIQEFVPGLPASASVVSSCGESVMLTLNEQIIGLSTVGQVEPFGYCGNIVPLFLSEETFFTCRELAEKIAAHFGLVGSNGVDFVFSGDGVPYVVEVNPRFQGTLECVEKVSGMNLVEAHVEAWLTGLVPEVPDLIPRFCTRLILFAIHRSVIPDLTVYPQVRDIPFPGVIIEEGEPVCSIIAEGQSRDLSYAKATSIAEMVINSLKPV